MTHYAMSSLDVVRQNAIFGVYKKIAIRNHLRMTLPIHRPALAFAPRPWMTREKGECAFPVDGEGVSTRSCCNPSGGGIYCAAHAAAMRGPRTSSADELEREIVAFLERAR